MSTSSVRQRKLVPLVAEALDSQAPTIKKLRKFDLYADNHIQSHVKERSLTGGIVFLVTAILMVALFLYELSFYMQIKRQDRLGVDVSVGGNLTIYFNVTFPAAPCGVIGVDTLDMAGVQNNNVRNRVYRAPVDENGRILAMPPKKELGDDDFDEAYDPKLDANSPTYCGPCYGAEEFNEQCCNTCESVKTAYNRRRPARGAPKAEETDQCLRESSPHVGCNIHGMVEVQKIPGNFHFAPGRSFSQSHSTHIHHVHEYDHFTMGQFNSSHIVHKLWFGQKIPGITHPLDSSQKIVEEGVGVYKYFVKVVPTSFRARNGKLIESNQYSVTHHFTASDPRRNAVLPGVFILYDLSPIQINYSETREPFSHFLVSVCMVVGGVFSLSGLFDRLVSAVFEHLRKNKIITSQ